MGRRKGAFLMFSTYVVSGAGALAAGYLTVAAMLGPPPFLQVESITQDGPTVTAHRRFNYSGTADWRVVIFQHGAETPICWTRPGANPNEGWSMYEVSSVARSEMHADEWAGDPGCYGRLKDGAEYTEIVTWTPWGPYDPVKHTRTFVRGAGA